MSDDQLVKKQAPINDKKKSILNSCHIGQNLEISSLFVFWTKWAMK